MARILGIDHGDRRFGVAISDAGGTFASPREVVEGEEALWRALERLIAEEAVERIVLGLPLNMDGSLGPRARKVLAFKERLERRLRLPVDTWDERLSSFQAENLLRAAGVRGRSRARRVDKVAAQIVLQSYLDHRRRPSGPGGEA
jgi:putative Holliday junction resolvase